MATMGDVQASAFFRFTRSRSRRVASKPSISGIWMSIKIRSKGGPSCLRLFPGSYCLPPVAGDGDGVALLLQNRASASRWLTALSSASRRWREPTPALRGHPSRNGRGKRFGEARADVFSGLTSFPFRFGRGGEERAGVGSPIQRRDDQIQQLGLLEGFRQIGGQAQGAALGAVSPGWPADDSIIRTDWASSGWWL